MSWIRNTGLSTLTAWMPITLMLMDCASIFELIFSKREAKL
jgi:hypothetical protein